MKTFVKNICAICLVILPMVVFAQGVLDDVVQDENTPNRNSVPYTSLRQADLTSKKVIWREIDLRDKINLQLYYPIDSLQGRKSLWDVIRKCIVPNTKDKDHSLPGLIPAYMAIGTNLDNGFVEMGPNDILPFLSDSLVDPSTGQPMRDANGAVLVAPTLPKDIVAYLIKEVWFFDRQRSVMDVRITGICPVKELKDPKTGAPNGLFQPMFWVYFPALRPYFAKVGVYNPENDAERRTIDDIFWKRQFSSYVIEESNVYNRKIEDYTGGNNVYEKLEAEKIQNKMFNFEHDMWEY